MGKSLARKAMIEIDLDAFDPNDIIRQVILRRSILDSLSPRDAGAAIAAESARQLRPCRGWTTALIIQIIDLITMVATDMQSELDNIHGIHVSACARCEMDGCQNDAACGSRECPHC